MAHVSPAKVLTPLRLYLLGSFRIEREGQLIHLPTRKVESLLADLVLQPEKHSREKLAALFWGDVTDTQARCSLRKALTLLRKSLGDEILIADREAVQINPASPLWVDALEFKRISEESEIENLESAIELYRGDLLSDFYDDWILPEQEHFRTLYLDMLLRLTQEMRSRSEYERAIAFAHQVLASDAADERAHQHLMFCYLAIGNRSAALQQYEECERVLQEELGVKPMPETTALYQWIKQVPLQPRVHAALLTNLPIPLSSFIGREREMAEVKQLLRSAKTRLLTFTGAGGCGKTRLAIQVAADLVDSFKEGVWWVELAGLMDATLLPQAVAKVLGVREVPNEPLSQVLASYLRGKQLLLVLDNCEHLVTACAQLAQVLLTASPGLKILITSREVLNITGEIAWRVPSLSLPDLRNLPPIPQLTQYEGVRLFVERAIAANPNFALIAQNAQAVAQVCIRLDGIPLAIELAVARVKYLSVQQIAARLDDRFNLLTVGSRTALPRHQTLRATLDWSYDLLTDAERVLFHRLSVFAGGFTLQAVEAVCADKDETNELAMLQPTTLLDLLSRLVDK
ncbi:MAG: hypothetical protein HY783_06185 [Chloroflexi bacterium]|nr:hypothetical protein [Chloroflexota bacterium]